ncbi:hypothetical protein LTR36_007341 [Oleoguttula mirabilis]|uniref:Uncharacterized protein n=1 Tax=Oleoguttula mirabilis TaxID=1507867 RepID=A0AAV9JAJ4_9PEZI|nr:hypothetical protein LTR36_007341 [Oleoguttula mirabilis]
MLHSILLAPALAVVLASISCLVSADDSNVTVEPAQLFPQYNSQRVKIHYGPFTAASTDVNNGMADFEQEDVQMPCTNCIITWMQAGLEYPNGTVANANTNLWLHHTVFANMNRTSTVCPGPDNPDTFFASGNERTPIDICANGTEQAGYYLASTDTLGMELELMNMSPTPQSGVLTMTYEYIPDPPSSFSHVKLLWLDIGGCNGSSDQPVKSATQAFQYTSSAWVSDISGKVTFVGGHLHDGGTHLEVQRNGTEECDCVATYGANSAYIGGGMSMSASMAMGSSSMSMSMSMTTSSSMDMASMSMPGSTSSMAMPTSSASSGLNDNVHISNISICSNPKNNLVSPGDVWTITAYYDPSQHDLMLDTNGTAAPIMGIALVYVADLNVTGTSSGSGAASPVATSTSGVGAGAVLEMGSFGIMCLGFGWIIVMGTVF